jgi:hypothetical protein
MMCTDDVCYNFLCLQAKLKKGKPKTRDYNPMDYDRGIRKCWKAAATGLKVDVNKYPIDEGHIVCVSVLLLLSESKHITNTRTGEGSSQ